MFDSDFRMQTLSGLETIKDSSAISTNTVIFGECQNTALNLIRLILKRTPEMS